MTPQLKAQELVDYFVNTHSGKLSDYSRTEYPTAKLFAIKLCDEVIEAIPKYIPLNGFGSALFDNPDIEYWQEIRKEIELL